MRHGDDFDWLGGHSANQEARGAHGFTASPPSPTSLSTFILS